MSHKGSTRDHTERSNRGLQKKTQLLQRTSKSRSGLFTMTFKSHDSPLPYYPPPPHLSSLRHWKWMDDRSNNTPVLSGSCLHSCMQWRSAASKSPDWYSRCASSANPWKESIRFVGSGAPTQAKEGENNTLEVMEEIKIGQMKIENKEMEMLH